MSGKEAAVEIRYIADMHFDHTNIIAYDNRPFRDAEEMNRTLIENWNRVVKPEDMTYIIGDFCGGDGARLRELFSCLNGKKFLILGNHDSKEAVLEAKDLLEGTAEYLEVEDGGRNVVLCHYPVFSFHNQYFGWYHLYGHVHTSYEWNMVENTKRLARDLYVRQDICRMLNVGAMLPYMDYTPRTLDELSAFA